MRSRPHILLIDDEPFFARPVIDSLKECYDVTFVSNAKDALQKIFAEAASIDLIILDVMMPTPVGVEESQTAGGVYTGLWLLGQIVPQIIGGKFAVVLFTNHEPSIIGKHVQQIGLSDKKILVVPKAHIYPNSFRDMVGKMIAESE